MRKGQHMTEEQKANCRRAQIKSPETKAKLSAALMGHSVSPETVAAVAAANRGRKASPETRAKRSAALKGRIKSPEWLAKIGAAEKGKVISLEARAKMSLAKWKGGPQVYNRKHKAKRRFLGFNPLNSPFPGCDAHHINPNDVIHIPRELHCSIRHNQYTGQGMAAMNALAGAFLTEDWT